MKRLWPIVLIFLITSCSSVQSVDRPASYYSPEPELVQEVVDASTFGEYDNRIRALLDYQVKLPEQSRIAILKLNSDSYWRNYSSEFNQLNESIVTDFIQQLRSSSRVFDASFLPAMLLGKDRSMPVLRNAAARFQADLLLAYRSSCESYQRYRFIKANETKSTCTVEAFLLDVRSGIIVKSIVSSEDFYAVKQEGDTNFRETIKKAELEATAKCLNTVAGGVVEFVAGANRL